MSCLWNELRSGRLEEGDGVTERKEEGETNWDGVKEREGGGKESDTEINNGKR